MKTIFIKTAIINVFLILSSSACEKNKNSYSVTMEGFIVGSFICDEVNSNTGQATGNKTNRGYCIELKGSDHNNPQWSIDFYTFNQLDELIDFPPEILTPLYNSANCGPSFFPDSIKRKYRIRFQYKILSNSQKTKFACGACNLMFPFFPWDDFNEVYLTNTLLPNP